MAILPFIHLEPSAFVTCYKLISSIASFELRKYKQTQVSIVSAIIARDRDED